MKKTRKQAFAEWLLTHQRNLNADQVIAFSNSQNLGVQVKTLDSDGNFVIKFSSSDPWIKPGEWLHNYKTSAKARYEEAAFVHNSLFPPENSHASSAGSDTSKEYNSLLSALNANPSSMGGKGGYPANLDKFFDDLSLTMRAYPKISRPETLLMLTIGRNAIESLDMLPNLLDIVAAEKQRCNQ